MWLRPLIVSRNGKRMGRLFQWAKIGLGLGSNSPALLSGKALVEQGQDLGDVELNVFQVQVVQVVLLHLQQVVELQIKLQEASVPSWQSSVSSQDKGPYKRANETDSIRKVRCLPL